MHTTLVNTSELSDTALDWAAAKAAGNGVHMLSLEDIEDWFPYSTEWEMAGPIIEQNNIGFYMWSNNEWIAHKQGDEFSGSTPLIAAMRCYVASKLGNSVAVPTELLTTVIKETT